MLDPFHQDIENVGQTFREKGQTNTTRHPPHRLREKNMSGSNLAVVAMIDRSHCVFSWQQLIKEAHHNVGVKRMVLQVQK